MKRIPELDGLRAVAILAVLTFHMGLNDGGFLGVDLFLVLSGFLITSILVTEQEATGSVNMRRFYARRARRILPPLIATIVIARAFASPLVEIPALPTLFFYANYIPPWVLGTLAHTWSLSVEEQFYLAWPLLLLVLGRRRVAFLFAVIFAALIARVVLLDSGMPALDVFRNTLARADSLALGCLAAIAHRQHIALPPAKVAATGFAGIVFVVIIGTFEPRIYGLWLTAFSAICALTLLAVLALPKSSLLARVLASKTMTYVGSRSYGLYLYHVPVFAVARDPLLGLGLTFVVAEISYRTIEARFRSAPRSMEIEASAAASAR